MTFEVNIPSSLVFSWESQVHQYPTYGEPGISYFAGVTEWGTVDCLLHRNEKGVVTGILNHYGFDSPWEKTGNVNVWVRRNAQAQGIGSALVLEAHRRWGVNLDQQNYTRAGVALAHKLRNGGLL